MRIRPIVLSVLLACTTPALAQLSISFGGPGVSIGINLRAYPTLQRIPGYPVYYAPSLNTNYFFYDGLYWVYEDDNWYASSWYNGPWTMVDRFDVPVYLLRVPVRYYRHAPSYFHGWRTDAAPRWGEHWGSSWEQRRSGWDTWNRRSAPAPAPLPTYQRQYSGDRYPRQFTEQAVINTRSYRYQPQDPVAREHFQYQRSQVQAAPAPAPAPQVRQRQQAQQVQQQAQPVPQVQQQAQRAQPALPPQANPAARAQREEAQDKGAQGKGQGQGQEKGKGRDKDKDKDKQER